MILGCVFEALPPATEGLGQIFSGQHHHIMGPSFLIFGHLNIPKVLERCWNLICVMSFKKETGGPKQAQ